MERQCFLATTALEDFWDTTKPILFLGEWCLLYERRSFWENNKWEMVSSPFQNTADAHAAYYYVDNVYEHILVKLAGALNLMHRKSYSLNYWRILIGPWLLHYLPVIYDRYKYIQKALQEHPRLTTIVLSETSFVIPVDTYDFAIKLSDDLFNLQIYSKVFMFFDKRFPSKEKQTENPCKNRKQTKRSFFGKIIIKSSSWYTSICSIFSRSFVVFTSSYFSRITQAKIIARSYGRVIPISECDSVVLKSEHNREMRDVLKSLSFGDEEFLKCLEFMLFSDMPQCFVEDFESINKIAMHYYPNMPKSILSANAWYFDEFFKFWAGQCADCECLLLGTQHGGDYGVKKFMLGEKHEINIVDYYYSWGWKWGLQKEKIIPMPANKFIKSNEVGANNSKKDILFVISSRSRYLVKFPYLPEQVLEYMDWQKIFIDGLSTELRFNMSIRPHRDDYGWSITARLEDHTPGIRLSSWDINFNKELNKCRIFVCDHLSTTYLQALVVNVPTILFWSPCHNVLKDEAQPYFDLLRDNGVLFDNPEDASAAICRIYDDIESWWNAPSRQNAIAEFCRAFARTDSKALGLWNRELRMKNSARESF